MKYINFSQLRSFHAVAKTGSITQASKLLSVSQPTITKQLQLLESFYQINLINRHARGISLTELGKKLYEITLNIFELEEEAIQLFSSNLNINKGTLVTGTSGSYYIIRLVKEFKKLHPGIKLKIISSNSNSILDDIIDYKIDVGVVGKPLSKNTKSTIYSIPYIKQKIVIIAGRGHKFYNKKTISIKELNDLDFINRERGSETRNVFEAALAKSETKINSIMEVERITMVQAVKDNMGLGLISEPEFDNYKDINKIHIIDYDLFTQAYLVCLKKKLSDNLIKAFIDTAKKNFIEVDI
jgi:LysR family transcriptional regulator, low CO2-responsive transcriptional regulator|tara:strand:- start:85 stop:978 length:894 start_codon:yes stop_codon:yes gene_type:complete